MCRLLILGAGQYGMVAEEIADSMGIFEGIAFLDDNNPAALGKLCEYEKFRQEYSCAVAAIGNFEMRMQLIGRLTETGFEVPVLIHKRAYVSPSAVIGTGSFIEPMAVVHTAARVGKGCIVSSGTVINHNAVVGDGCHLNCCTVVRSTATVPAGTVSDYGQILGR
jgi:acetyltransferase-like isoleucine patch superfamily enzyme